MSTGHTHQGGPHMTQNQGNVLGDRPCVRQSRLYREHVGGNEMKGILGQDNLKWDTQRTQGAYEGGRVYDAEPNQRQQQQQAQPYGAAAAPQQYGEQQRQQYSSFPQQQQQQQQLPQSENYQRGVPAAEGQRQGGGVCWQQGPPPSAEEQQQLSGGNHRRGAGVANRTTYNIFTGE